LRLAISAGEKSRVPLGTDGLMDAIACKATKSRGIAVKWVNLTMPLFIQTPRFVIRDFKPEEQDLFVDIFEDERVIVHLPKRGRKELIDLFQWALKEYASGSPLSRWGIFNNGDGDFIGFCLLRLYDNQPGRVELGYALHQKYWGKGIASDMAKIMVAQGFMHTDATELVAVTTLGNIGSQKVLLKAGMTRMPDFRRDGEDLAFFSMERK
jgi:ribosomal-protein-alanine N-acetyltransferase